MKDFGKYVRIFYNEVMQYDFRRDLLLGILETCKEIMNKAEVAEVIAKKRRKRKNEILYQMDDKKSKPLEVLGKLGVVLLLPKPEVAEKRNKAEYIILTDVGKWIKSCKYGDEIALKPPQDLMEVVALIGRKAGKYDSKQLQLYLITSKYANLEDPKIEIDIEILKDPDWGRPGCKIRGRVEEDGLSISDDKKLKRDLKKLATYWIREIMFQYSKYDEEDVMRIICGLKFDFRYGDNFIEFEAKVEPYGILK